MSPVSLAFSDEGDTISTAGIIAESANFACTEWSVVGACFWMTCTPFGCDFDFSVKVKHYIPDAVVSTYKNTGENPWSDVAFLSPPTGFARDGGSNSEGSTSRSEQALRFKNADAIGSPGTILFDALANSGLFCESGATFAQPYFMSSLDPNWRDPTIETPLTLLNAFRSVGKGASTWAGLYPRIGFVNQGHDYKAGVVTAQRAADIVTRTNQPHVYWPMVWSSSRGYWPPGEVVEANSSTHKWQQLVPKGNSGACIVFPDIDDVFSITDPFNSRVNEKSGYAWNLWRPYRCCEREGSVLLFHTGN